MSTQKLVLMKAVSAERASKGIGSVSVAPEGNGLLFRVELRGAPAGVHQLTINENSDCGVEEIDGVKVAAGAAGVPWSPDGLKSPTPTITVPSDGYVKTEFMAPGFEVRDLRGRSLVLTSGGQRVGCGVSN
jgi:Cu/Zn superoxide dismutase